MSRTRRRNRKTGRPERDSYWRNTHQSFRCTHAGGCPHCVRARTLSRAPSLREELKGGSDDG